MTVRFAGLLEAEAALFDELAALMPLHRRALLDADAETLESCAAGAETLAMRFRMIDEERTRLEDEAATDLFQAPEPVVGAARERYLASLETLMRCGAVDGTLLARLSDTAAARQAAITSLTSGAAYSADGRPSDLPASGLALSKEG